MAAKPAKAYDTDEFVSVASGTASAVGSDSGLADSLLEATSLLTKVGVLLAEASADDWREVRPRINALRSAIKLMPKTSPRRKRVGY